MRSLILAGGGIKVGFQAGVLQVWMDEANLSWDHADGASGGCFNLAMYCQGMSGTEIADNWRKLRPRDLVSVNKWLFIKLLYAPSIATLTKLRTKVFPAWMLDFGKIRAGKRLGTFNICNFSDKRLQVFTNEEITEDHLVASVSLPMWFPPVRMNGKTYVDSVYLSDANVEEAIRRGADEIWAIWTVSTQDVWNDGFVAQYFQTIEIAADGRFFDVWRRIERNNWQMKTTGTGEFGRTITLRLLQAEVPIHYLVNLSTDRMNESVELGVKTAREWCRAHGIPLSSPGPAPVSPGMVSLQFTETMHGYVTQGQSDPELGRDAPDRHRFDFRLTIGTTDLDAFIRQPEHQGTARGEVHCDAFGGTCAAENGWFNIFVFAEDPHSRKMLYRLFFRDQSGQPFTLAGVKSIDSRHGEHIWRDTTTLFTRVFYGHIAAEDEAAARLWGSGVLVLNEWDFLKQLGTFDVQPRGLGIRLHALRRFGELFLGALWDVYAQRVLSYAPF